MAIWCEHHILVPVPHDIFSFCFVSFNKINFANKGHVTVHPRSHLSTNCYYACAATFALFIELYSQQKTELLVLLSLFLLYGEQNGAGSI